MSDQNKIPLMAGLDKYKFRSVCLTVSAKGKDKLDEYLLLKLKFSKL